MASTEELEAQILADMESDPEAYADTEIEYCTVDDDTRVVTVPEKYRKLGVESDEAAKRIWFRFPKLVGNNGIDLSAVSVRVNFRNANGDGDIYMVQDLTVDGDYVVFSWELSRKVTAYKGSVSFVVCAVKSNTSGVVKNEWNTTLSKSCEILEGLEVTEQIAQENPDIIEYILSNLGGSVSAEQIATAVEEYMASHPFTETDPTVSEWAKQPQKPTYTASEVGAEASGTADGKVSAHNTAGDAHNDIRELISGLTQRLNALADSDDTTLDQMSEIVAYIKSNKSLIDAITTSKVSVSDIIDNLATNVSNKPLSAAQGVILKTMIDEITIPEKLPNPYSLTFTGSVAGIYNGSEALTINIPSGGDGSTYYVTPEQFGAIGDGVTDDSEAFRQAIETEKPIVCTYGKKYNCITEIVTENTTINIIGNRCMLKNFHLKINVNSGETSWINAYPVPNSTIQDVNFNGTDKPEYCIKTGIPIKFLNCKWDFYDIMVKNYGSYMDYMVFENCAFKNHSGTHYAIDLDYLGDQHVFRECDFGGTGENRKFVSLSGCQSATIINCLFAGDHIIYSSNVVFIGCHMEGVSSITVGGDKTWDTILHFIDCYFWDMYTLSLADSSHFFDSCTFYISHQCIVGGRDYTLYNQKNCKILCATTSDPNSYVNLDDLVNRKEFPERKTLSNPCVYQSSAGAVAQGRNWPLNTGSYTYLFFPSTNPYSIDGWNFYYTKATLTFTISSDSSIVSFTGNSDFAGYYLWCYRTSPDGTIHRTIIPMHMDRFYDYGQYMNGVPWTEVDAIPDPETSLATVKNGIYYSSDGSCNGKNCMCINTSNGLISYISNDGVVHQNEYVDASEVMY